MTRLVLTAVLLGLISVLAGCHGIDSGKSQLISARIETVQPIDINEVGESDIIEQMVIDRQAYRVGLKALAEYYNRTGNNMKLGWVNNEIKSLDKMPQYNYIIEASVAGPGLRARASITEADYMYYDALRLEKKAKKFVVINDDKLLRTVLRKYNNLIRRHPTSDKIDDAAFMAAGIFEHFKDYTIALLYYRRAYQWDSNTIHPAMFKAAYILDTKFHRRAEAMELYQQALKRTDLKKTYREIAEKRLMDFSKTSEEQK